MSAIDVSEYVKDSGFIRWNLHDTNIFAIQYNSNIGSNYIKLIENKQLKYRTNRTDIFQIWSI